MKHILTALLLLMAVCIGLFLPEATMGLQDRSVQAPQTLEIAEPALEFHPGENQTETPMTDAFPQRLSYFASGPSVTVPLNNADSTQQGWAIQLCTEFLTQAIDIPLEIHYSYAEYQLAWFEDGTTFPFWAVCIEFNQGWVCIMTIDAETDGILQFILDPNGGDLGELFPEAFEQAADVPGAYFENLVTQRICDTLTYHMENTGIAECIVSPGEESDTVQYSFPDDPGQNLPVFFMVDLVEGINFNNPVQYG